MRPKSSGARIISAFLAATRFALTAKGAAVPVSRNSLAAHSSGGGVKPAGQNRGFWPEDTFNSKKL